MAALKEHGILFSAPMVKAILAGQKWQTRRAVKFPDGAEYDGHRPDGLEVRCSRPNESTGTHAIRAPHGPVGRRLWVRECWHQCPHCEGTVSYRAGGWTRGPTGAPDDGGDRCDDDARPLSPKCEAHGWRPSIHMPRWASRITLEVTRVRVERVQGISDEDIAAEGVTREAVRDLLPVHAFKSSDAWNEFNEAGPRDLWRIGWRAINGDASWDANPWVWVYDFRRVE